MGPSQLKLGGQYWMPITPNTGSNLHAETHLMASHRGSGDGHCVDGVCLSSGRRFHERAHHLRPRCGWSDRRPSSLRSASFLNPQQPVATFFPCWLRHPRGPRKPRPGCPSLSFRPSGCGPIASGLSTAIEVAVVAARETHGDDIMATIGTFTSNGNGLGHVPRSVL